MSISLTIPATGASRGTSEASVSTDLTTIQAALNAILKIKRVLMVVKGEIAAGSAAESKIAGSASTVAAGEVEVGGQSGPFYFDPAEHEVTGTTLKLRLTVDLRTNEKAPGTTITFALKLLEAGAGGGTNPKLKVGATVTEVAITTPAAKTLTHSTVDVAAPAAGLYAVFYIPTAETAASSKESYGATVSVYNV